MPCDYVGPPITCVCGAELGELLTCGETRHGKLGCETSGPDPSCSFEPTRVPRLKPFTVTKVSWNPVQ